MKNRRLWLVILSLVVTIFACLCLAACGDVNTGNGGDKGDGNGDGKDPIVPIVPATTELTAPYIHIRINGKATWNNVANASGYVFKIDDGAEQTAENREVVLENNQSIAVKAKGDGVNYSDSKWSEAITYKAPKGNLAAPENLTVRIQGTDMGKVVVSWDAVAGTHIYEYAINGPDQNSAMVFENAVTVDLSEIDETKLDDTWVFQVRALSDDGEDADDGDYSDWYFSSNYCAGVEFKISDDDIYTVAEITKIINYYGEHIPNREFMVGGKIAENKNGNAVLEGGFTLFGEYVPELYLAIDDRLEGLEVTAMGTLVADGEVKGLSSYRSVDFEDIEENDRYDLVIETLNAWDILNGNSKVMGDLYLPAKLYGVNMLWEADDDDTGAFVIDDYGNVTVTCPADGEEDIYVILTALMYIDEDHEYDGELGFELYITSDVRIQLAAPKVNINPKTGVATWNKIDNAIGYRVNYYGFSTPGDYYSEYIDKTIIISANGNREVTLKDTWWIKVWAIGDGVTYKDSEVDPKQYNYYPETVEPDGTPLDFDMIKLTQTGKLANPTYIFGLACGNASVFESASATNVELGNSDSHGVVTGTGFIKVGSASSNGKITLNFNKRIKGVVITARQW
ncbi:MAG: hypothetical protein K2F90_06705, partial [Clostridiales bacterium]|nr:hypothetical protein [Clostridiales bacterium]